MKGNTISKVCSNLVVVTAVAVSLSAFGQIKLAPVEVVGRDVAWSYREKATGCVVEFTNMVGILRRKGKPDVLDPRMVSHASVFYRPNGTTYTFDLAPTGTLSVVLNDRMPKIPARFSDASRYALVNAHEPFDLGITADRPSQRVLSNRWDERFFIKTVPSEMYTRGWALCAVTDDPKRERKFTVRITRWMDDSEWNYTGRGVPGMAVKLVDFNTAKKERVGEVELAGKKAPLWLVEFPLDLGDIQDVVYTDNNGNFLHAIGRYLDFEVCGSLKTRVTGLHDRTMNTDPERVSAVTFYGAALEKPAASFAMSWVHPGNVFGEFDTRETLVNLSVKRPGKYTLAWTVTDGDTGKPEKPKTHVFSSDELFRLDLSNYKQPGWYALDWKLTDAEGATLMTHAASFAVLGKDTRLSKQGEGPYATWDGVGPHYCTPNQFAAYNGELMSKLGVRLTSGVGMPGVFGDEKFRERWKIGRVLFSSFLHGEIKPHMTDEEEAKLVEKLKKRRAEYPEAFLGQLFWESSYDAYRQAPEITGGTFDPSVEPIKGFSNRVEQARAVVKFMRRHFPEIKISIGQSICCSELIAEQIRAGLGDKDIDYMGLEHVGRANLPERSNSASMQTADLFREMAERMGRPFWKPGCGVETNFRRDTFLGQERQARYYVRDALLGVAWRFPLVNVGGLVDAGNQYCETAWGNAGLCKRWPMLYPKKSYVAYAALTKTLDCVTDARALDTGDDCAYVMACPRRDGRTAYAIWTSYGEAEFELSVSGEVSLISFFGRESTPKVQNGTLKVTASERPQYLVVEGGEVSAVKTLGRAYPEDVKPTDYKALVRCEDAAKWKLVAGRVDGVYGELGSPYPTCRQPAKAPAFAVVDDPELGKCLELDLGCPDLSLPKAVFEYAVIELKEPVAIPGEPQSLGAVVKGNSGWGRLYWIIEGADGKRAVSSGHRGWGEDFDDVGKMSLGFTGWRFLHYPVGEHSSIRDYSINLVSDLWCDGIDEAGAVKYPAKLVGVAFAAESRPLFLSERRHKEQKVRIAEIGFFD